MKNSLQFRTPVALLPIAGIFLLGLVQNLNAQHAWKLHAENDGIKVYTSKQDSSAYNAIRVTFEVESTLSEYAALVLNVPDYKNWNAASSKSTLIKKINDSELLYYTEAKSPWPIADRYVVLHLKLTLDPASKFLKIMIEDAPDQIPEKKGLVRINDYSSCLKAVPVSSGRLKVDYVLKIDPGGNVPAWAVNLVSANMPVKTFSNLKNKLESQQDQTALGSGSQE
ncbi:MAG: hypothetical protein H6574_03560 [Lewinellaceae bacterium]|nr:hypothetical protein [Saprospiraceae bacterium]MCB9330136.1 hypothetical protein [Lewinellaceae bacterium]